MKYTIVFVALLLASSWAVGIHKSLTNAQIRKIEKLKSGNTWGSFLMNLAEMHVLAQGPFDELTAAIGGVITDIESKIESANAEFDKRTQFHSSETRRLTDLINEASRNIAETQELIDNILLPQRDQLNEEINNLNREIEATKQHIVQATAEREAAHNDFLVRVEEHNSALAAIQEALQVLGQLNGDVSLIQMKKFHKSMEKIQKNMQGKKNVETTLIKSLLQLSNSGFADSDAVQKVTNLLLEVKSNLENSLVTEQQDEVNAQAAFEADVAASEQKIVDFTASVAQKSEELARTEEQIVQSHQYIEERTADRATYTNDLAAENEAYEVATANFNELVAQLNTELAACQEALDVVNNASIEDYIGNRVSQTSEHVIDTQHGSGVRSGVDNIEFQ